MFKGRLLSEDHKRHISEAHKAKGELHWCKRPEVREKMRLAKLGKPLLKNIGHIVTTETRRKISNSVSKVVKRGKDCNFWKGGINKLTWSIRKCLKYRQWRSDIFTRDDYTCQICSIRGGKLIVHHCLKSFSRIIRDNNIKTIEEAENCEELWNLNNGQTLCDSCHKKTDDYLVKQNYNYANQATIINIR